MNLPAPQAVQLEHAVLDSPEHPPLLYLPAVQAAQSEHAVSDEYLPASQVMVVAKVVVVVVLVVVHVPQVKGQRPVVCATYES